MASELLISHFLDENFIDVASSSLKVKFSLCSCQTESVRTLVSSYKLDPRYHYEEMYSYI